MVFGITAAFQALESIHRQIQYPLAWGLGTWGLGAIAYDSGYLGYSNPYFNRGDFGQYGNYNYSVPVPVNYYNPNNPYVGGGTIGKPLPVLKPFRFAVHCLKQTNYDAALDVISHALVLCVLSDAALHELRAAWCCSPSGTI